MQGHIERIALLGASRGLGFSVAKLLGQDPLNQLLIVARRKPVEPLDGPFEFFAHDFSQGDHSELLGRLRSFAPHRIFYFAGGGPHGLFAQKEFKDHQWAWKVNFEAPARIVWEALRGDLGADLTHLVVTGSAVAEATPDPYAASYAAGKHALKGLIETIRAELAREPALKAPKIQLFSPGYMDTSMLPQSAWPRQNPGLVQDPNFIAAEFLKSLEQDLV